MEIVLALGLMSGAAGDAIEAALIETDSYEHFRPLVYQTFPYGDGIRELIREAKEAAAAMPIVGSHPIIDQAQSIITSLHVEAVRKLLTSSGFEAHEIEVLGLSGHCIQHRPAQNMTWQLGNGDMLATETRIATVSDFAKTDVANGGNGAPLLPVFHRSLFYEEPKPLGILDLGHTAKLTTFYSDGQIYALDCGPGMALIDAWCVRHGAGAFDSEGLAASRGVPDEDIIQLLVRNPWFLLPAPKSLNPADFTLDAVAHLGFEDGLATLTAFAAECVARAIMALADRPNSFWLSGGGRKNDTLVRMITARSGIRTENIDRMGWQGDQLDAQAIAYLAIRRLAAKSSTFPETTGVPVPHSAGTVYTPLERRSLDRL